MNLDPMAGLVKELKEMNDNLTNHLKTIIHKLDRIIEQNDNAFDFESRHGTWE